MRYTLYLLEAIDSLETILVVPTGQAFIQEQRHRYHCPRKQRKSILLPSFSDLNHHHRDHRVRKPLKRQYHESKFIGRCCRHLMNLAMHKHDKRDEFTRHNFGLVIIEIQAGRTKTQAPLLRDHPSSITRADRVKESVKLAYV